MIRSFNYAAHHGLYSLEERGAVRPEERAELINKLLAQKTICFDTETTGLDPRTALPLGFVKPAGSMPRALWA